MRAKRMACLAVVAACWAQANAQPSANHPPAAQTSERAAILAAFRSDIAVCKSIVKLLSTDRAFMESFTPHVNRASKQFLAFLLESSNYSSTEFQYVLRNQEYLDIDVWHHGEPFAVAWVENEGIYCAPTLARLREIEALGESEEAWNVRQFFLGKMLASLEHPSHEITSGLVDFEAFMSFVAEANGRYEHTHRHKFIAWTLTAIRTIESSRKDIQDGANGSSLSEQNKILDDRVSRLRAIAAR